MCQICHSHASVGILVARLIRVRDVCTLLLQVSLVNKPRVESTYNNQVWSTCFEILDGKVTEMCEPTA